MTKCAELRHGAKEHRLIAETGAKDGEGRFGLLHFEVVKEGLSGLVLPLPKTFLTRGQTIAASVHAVGRGVSAPAGHARLSKVCGSSSLSRS